VEQRGGQVPHQVVGVGPRGSWPRETARSTSGPTWASRVAQNRRTTLLDATSDTTTRVRSEESMAGPLLPLVYGSAKLQAGLEQWLTALKAAAERP
jgi:hypothetical protein